MATVTLANAQSARVPCAGARLVKAIEALGQLQVRERRDTIGALRGEAWISPHEPLAV